MCSDPSDEVVGVHGVRVRVRRGLPELAAALIGCSLVDMAQIRVFSAVCKEAGSADGIQRAVGRLPDGYWGLFGQCKPF